MSPWKGLVSISSIAARTRTRSWGGMRLSAFRAGPARMTSQDFISAELIKGHVVAPLERRLAPANGAKLGRRGRLFREPARREIGSERLTEKLRARPMFPSHRPFNLLRHPARQRDSNGNPCSHRSWVLPGNTFSYRVPRKLILSSNPSAPALTPRSSRPRSPVLP